MLTPFIESREKKIGFRTDTPRNCLLYGADNNNSLQNVYKRKTYAKKGQPAQWQIKKEFIFWVEWGVVET